MWNKNLTSDSRNTWIYTVTQGKGLVHQIA